ncbi:carbon monoxide dehydrogenase [Loktanella sp. D2R18]|uniref:FAD binding domain-containing protein n=1 Tax=Rhodobacterales TaxID=204455 RepID=UPI000DE836EC|nr:MULTISPECIES: FAD binding domain-containing protein [Rhodobacterales]MDO6591876.1 FAD binding domain-containing protein [Yoonia sp. 1_MG-2023]RBW44828.1 carbon monoxide dehydrogenase [Loktanella sp. D2R18]
MYPFEITSPLTIDAAVEALENEEAQPLAGGQTLIPTLKARLAMPEVLVSLTGIKELQSIAVRDGQICVGAGVTHANLAKQTAQYPALAALAADIGDPAVRNRGTIGGSLANNDPAACYPAAALGSGATIVTNTRAIAADDYFLAMFETALEEGEIITEVRFPMPKAAHYAKFAQPASRFALVGVFVAQFVDGVRVAVTGASEEGVFRWLDAETALSQAFSAQALGGLTVPPEGMMGDIHGSSDYRAHLITVLTKRAVIAAG